MKRLSFVPTLAVLVLLAVNVMAFAQEEADDQEQSIEPNRLPTAVLTAFQTTYPNAKILGASREMEDNVTYYEIESKDGHMRRDLLYLENGTVHEIEEKVKEKDVPEVVQTAVLNAHPGADIEKGERIIQGGKTTYELMVEVEDQDMEILVSSSGTILKTTIKSDEDDEEEDDD